MREKDIEIRFATNDEGHLIRDLLLKDGYHDIEDFNWDLVNPYWLVAISDNEFIGCIEILIGYPVGVLEFMATEPELSNMQRALVIKMLSKRCLASYYKAHVSAVVGHVPFYHKAWKKILKRKWGAGVIGSGNSLLKKLVDSHG